METRRPIKTPPPKPTADKRPGRPRKKPRTYLVIDVDALGFPRKIATSGIEAIAVASEMGRPLFVSGVDLQVHGITEVEILVEQPLEVDEPEIAKIRITEAPAE